MTDEVIVSQRLIKGKKSNLGDMMIIGERKPWEGGIFHAEGDTHRDKRDMMIIGERKQWDDGIFHAEGNTDRLKDPVPALGCFILFFQIIIFTLYI